MSEDWEPERERQLLELFEEVQRLEGEERVRFLERTAREDPPARARLDQLLRRLTEAPEVPQLEIDADFFSQSEPHDRIGHYRIERLIASGGMGQVFEAQQEHPRRRVALKVLRRDLGTDSAVRRFEYESELLARLDHDGVARVYEAGVHVEQGLGGPRRLPFFAMEFVEGATDIVRYCEREHLDHRARLRLFIAVCHAVHSGHVRGIVHRDLKPSNLLIDGRGRPKVIDYGVARSIGPDVTRRGFATEAGFVVGTLAYMSPEQFEGDPRGVDVRNDVYSLGVVLYQLLSGSLPYDVQGMSLPEAATLVREGSLPELPREAAHGSDLKWIVRKALDKQKDRRYASVLELAADIEHYLSDEPVRAGPPSSVYRLRKFVRRNPLPIALSLALLVVLGTVAAALVELRVRGARLEEQEHTAQYARYVALPQVFDDLIFRGPGPTIDEDSLESRIRPASRMRAVFEDHGILLNGSLTPVEIAQSIESIRAARPEAGERLWHELGGMFFILDNGPLGGALSVSEDRVPDWASPGEVAEWTMLAAEHQDQTAWLRRIMDTLVLDPTEPMARAWELFFSKWENRSVSLDEIHALMKGNGKQLEWLAAATHIFEGSAKAEPIYREALEEDPSLYVARLQLGHYLTDVNYPGYDPEEALRHYEILVAQVPRWHDAWVGLSGAHGGLRDVSNTERCARRALDLNPSSARAWHNLGWSCANQGRVEEAAEAYQRSLEFRPGSPSTRANYARAIQQLGRTDEALAQLERVRAEHPSYTRLGSNRADILLGLGRATEAVEAFGEDVGASNSAVLHARFGHDLLGAGALDFAVEQFLRAIELDGENFEAQRGLLIAFVTPEGSAPGRARPIPASHAADPDSGSSGVLAGWTRLGRGDATDGLATLRAAAAAVRGELESTDSPEQAAGLADLVRSVQAACEVGPPPSADPALTEACEALRLELESFAD